ncbi:MAG: 3' terminal RNA ribose 2'-O-methyltransferase Hen1 [Spirochaetaceae bacterium]|jgi:2-polyprenyl-3-methyl-5-hydroxy-6-metoxy-1,4-benzoquinol methylase|nr:3' terminal RNA ribose 2'-O-methyltransferase Hen1 [Spirochaetaceae bacterium]
MLFTITYTGENPTDLGYLLHKNPARPQSADLSFGRVHVFYPETGPGRCTAALLLDIDPLDLVRGRRGGSGIFDYVNDRPYVCSSFMCTAISGMYGTAMSGSCAKKQELADAPLDLRADLFMLPCRGGLILPELLFGPLGYEVRAEETALLDERFSEWGNSPYINLTIRGKVRLRDLLNHIYVLIPVFDRQKHYWIGEDEIDKLLTHGKGWLEDHPERALIARRYFKNLRTLTRGALDRLDNGEGAAEAFSAGELAAGGESPFFPGQEQEGGGAEGIAAAVTAAMNTADEDEPTDATAADDDSGEPVKTVRPRLNTQRLEAVLRVIKESGAQSVIDFGCGEGNLLRLLMKEKTFTRVAGVDVSRTALEHARDKLKTDRLPEAQQKRLSLFQSSVTYRDKRFRDYDAAALVEVMEHLEENRLDTLAAVILGDARPGILALTTPNIEYNEIYGMPRFRHGDHRFEWNRDRFQSWAKEAAQRYGYEVSFESIGEADEKLGAPTQMGIFKKSNVSRGLPCA